ncbi:hypothetical protein A3F07_02110 [candidate division WWE3 bacterium RIFCSPHIGHO2_12_FULL_38_15]|uniref:Uncharacterized protein n=1 Tax=candidate division WWE3 bacterium RIFCSPHIGHO2_02_FULL_38_14 TaxID=1802620 RepID=A0A1F4V8H6_UNCKA|nr:MAG: hypothetical protein A2793_03345 [candidate division WWE3 bacterium RIFCSPHIGHO2_01_FULL_38_45]OGC48675.1 MAG: hypothetical protein A3F07_02110 [candidate division WWE3 bacterium RIFCSPHIGHO2_12_FULL_38_15]OGC53081.1 MAG: hypothetical protein A3B64_01370 [candidate division WWE3 bacterium RIFCSPLOWO2_01_FULL_37_24]OGC53444.1 MAG: hypothetical protein A3D91_00225 [candidate division WWE3 bacterium RIFCSPHIGHO2_02_FULL_38_14]HLB51918.1 MiaB/RimO family radical SAM methylthiotransferase [P
MNDSKIKTYSIKTFGCQANIADSNTISGVLEALGLEEAEKIIGSNDDETFYNTAISTDVLIMNTCSVRQKSEDKVYGLGKMLKLAEKDARKKPFIVMAGCMVGSVTGERQRYAFEVLKKKTPWVDVYINPSQIMNIPEILLKNSLLSDWAVQKFDSAKVLSKQDNPTHAFVNISYGCDNFCTFCVVPYSRGKEVSRSENDILKEIRHFAGRGIKEITLCGQNVNSWGLSMTKKMEIRTGSDQKIPFTSLLKKIHNINEIEKIGFISSNPFDFTNDLVETLKLPKISRYLHIAVQSGNNTVLKNMNRRHTVEDFINLIDRIKGAKPNIELGTDIIVGFPGETREQFLDTVRLFEKINFNVAYISMYSPRKGTPAERFFKDDVPLKEKKWRHAYLTSVWKKYKNGI